MTDDIERRISDPLHESFSPPLQQSAGTDAHDAPLNVETAQRYAHELVPTTSAVLGDGVTVRLGEEVALADEWASLTEFNTFGSIRSLQKVGDTGDVRVGVLWFGFGGMWVRHYLASQLTAVRVAIREADGFGSRMSGPRAVKLDAWVVAGSEVPGEEEQLEAAEAEVRPVVERLLTQGDDEQFDIQAVLAQAVAELGEEKEQAIRDVLTEFLAVERINATDPDENASERISVTQVHSA